MLTPICRRYVIQISTKTAQLPYADAFIPSIRYCISWGSPTHSRLSICMGVKFVKNILVKGKCERGDVDSGLMFGVLGMVMKAALKGMGESITQFTPMIMDACNKVNGGPRKEESVGVLLTDSKETVATPLPSTGDSKQLGVKEDDGWVGQAMAIWEMIQDLVPVSLVGVLVGALALWFLWSWSRSGAKQRHQVVSRAVYLRDVEEGLLHHNTTKQQVSYMDPYW